MTVYHQNKPKQRNSFFYRFILTALLFIITASAATAQFHQIHIEPDEDDALKLSLYSPAEGYVAFRNYIGFTIDSGKTFTTKTITTSNVNYNNIGVNLTFGFEIQGVHAVNQNNIFVYGDYGLEPTILYSTDGGNTFKIVFHAFYDPSFPQSRVTDMVFPQNGLNGYAVYAGKILKTTNGGLNWAEVNSVYGTGFSSIEYLDDNHVFTFSPSGTIYKTADGGGTWSVINIPSGGILQYATFLSPGKGWLNTFDGGVYLTFDGGTSWAKQNPQPLPNITFNKMKFINDSTGFALGGNIVYKTSNSGKIWERLYASDIYSDKNYALNDFQFLGATAWAAGVHGYIEASNNGGGPTFPKAIFAIDTTGLSVSGKVKLQNYTRSGYQYQWFLNNKQISTAYNTTYTHDIYSTSDTIQLIVTNKTYKDTLVQYQQFNPPVIVSGFTPTSGGTGIQIIITGINFQNATGVIIGGVPAKSFTVNSSTSITVIVGSGASGKIGVITPFGEGVKDGFTYVPPPAISSVSPLKAAAGSNITITGSNFTGVTTVTFGGRKAKSFTVVNDGQITAVLGVGNSGDVVVANAYGSASVPGFVMIPVVTAFTPLSGTNGTVLNIQGTGLDQVSSVSVGGFPVKSFVVDSATSVTALVDTGGTGYVLITAPGGSVSTPSFTYYKPPVITSFAPLTGPVGTVVTIIGSNFSAVKADNTVYFGAVKAVILSATSNSLTVQVPAGITYHPIIVETHHLVSYAKIPFTTTFANGGGISSTSFTAATGSTLSAATGLSPVIMDLDGDGKPDITTFNPITHSISVLVNNTVSGNLSYVQQDIPALNVSNYSLTDLDGDGKPDLVAVDITIDAISVYRNISTAGKIAFDKPVAMSGDVFLLGLKVYDMDGDGKPDIVATNSAGGNGFSIYRNKSEPGKLAFYERANVDLGGGSGMVIGDLDNDGKPDLVVSYNTDNTSAAFRNTSTPGNLSFDGPVDFGPAILTPLALGDIDSDGKNDIVALNSSQNKLVVYLNTSNGPNISFASATSYQTGNSPLEISVDDLDGDGKPDIAVNCTADNKISLFKNVSTTGNIQLALPVDFATSPNTGGLTIGDLDGDGKNDLLFNQYSNSIYGLYTLLNNVKPAPVILSFTPTNGVAGTPVTIKGLNFAGTTAVTFGGVKATSFTVNADKTITAVLGNGASGVVTVTNTFGVAVLPGFAYGAPPVITSFSPVSGIAGTNVTIAGKNFDPTASNNTVYFGAVKANVVSATATKLVVNAPAGATYQPITIATNNYIGYSQLPFTLTFPNGANTFNQLSFTSKYLMVGWNATAGDLDGDGKADLVFLSGYGNANLLVARNIGVADSISFAANQIIGAGSTVLRMYLADMNADGKLDIVCLNNSPATITMYLNTSTTGNISFSAPVTLADPVTSQNVVGITNLDITDIDGDGLPDIATANYQYRTVSVFRNQTAGSKIQFGQKFDYIVNGYADDVKITDIDGDGKADLVALSNSNGHVSVFKNVGTPGAITLADRTDFAGEDWPAVAYVGDFDGDGKPDLVIANTTANGSISFYRNTSIGGNISFDKTNKGNNILPGTGVVADLNGDGKPDFLFNDQTSGGLNLYKNSSTANSITFNDQDDYLFPAIGGYTAIADMDQDGRPDIIQSYNNNIVILRNSVKKLLTLPDTNFRIQFTGSTCKGSKNGSITLNASLPMSYTATVTRNNFNSVQKFTKTFTVGNLDTGAYNVCITVAGYPDFQQCFSAKITEPKDLSVYAVVNSPQKTVNLNLSGGDSYTVQLNNSVYHTTQSDFSLPLQKGNNELTVSTDKPCQGMFTKRITIGNEISVYPNPFVGNVQMDVGESLAPLASVEIVDMYGKKVFSTNTTVDNGKLNLDLSLLDSGIYLVKLTLDNKQSVYKIWKK